MENIIKPIFHYTWKVLKKFWVFSLAILPDISDFITNYIYPDFSFNFPRWISTSVLVFGFLLSTFLVWQDEVKRNKDLQLELEKIKKAEPEYILETIKDEDVIRKINELDKHLNNELLWVEKALKKLNQTVMSL